MKYAFLLTLMIFFNPPHRQVDHPELQGAWKSADGVLVFSGAYFSYAQFDAASKQFEGTYGGSWSVDGNTLNQTLEFDTFDKGMAGQSIRKKIDREDNRLTVDDTTFERIDDGTPGRLTGAWLFAGRKQGDQLMTRDTNQPRKTMKILSGTRFQWIAYNVETAEFFGTGGGTYTTGNGKYTENIDFFSRDSSRVGASLSFDYETINGVWHHSGLNSRGEPLYEIWSQRE